MHALLIQHKSLKKNCLYALLKSQTFTIHAAEYYNIRIAAAKKKVLHKDRVRNAAHTNTK